MKSLTVSFLVLLSFGSRFVGGAPTPDAKKTSSTKLTSSLNPSTFGQPVTFTATATPLSATGTITFKDGTTVLGTKALSSGVATAKVSTLSAGTHSLTAVYSGDSVYNGSTSPVLKQKVNKSGSSVTLTSSPNPSTYGSAVTFTATVTPSAATGSVTFMDGTITLGTGTLSGGSAHLTTSVLNAGAHSITAVYGGDANHDGSTSPAVTQTVNKAATSVTLTSSLNPSTYGASVTFTATVTPSTATGTVTFIDGTTSLGSATISGGTAHLATTALTAGSHSINAAYGGDSNYTGSTSPVLTQTVSKAGSSVTLTSSLDPSTYGTAVTFTAAVTGAGATGTVTFYDASTQLGIVNLSGGTVAITTSTLAGGTHPITAAYSGDTNYNGSTSPVVSQIVTLVLLSITVSPQGLSLAVGSNGQQYTALGNYNDGSNQDITASVTWASSAPIIATITSGGLATAVAQGSTAISATQGSVTGSSTLTVYPLYTFFVAPNGKDTWKGDLSAPNSDNSDGPFASPGQAALAVESTPKGSPINVYLRAGTYYLALSPTKPGTLTLSGAADSGTSASAQVTWQNYAGETPVLSGGVPVTGWSPSGGNWQTKLPAGTAYFENLFYNGSRRLRPRLGGYLGPAQYFRFVQPVYLASESKPNCTINVIGKGWECFDRFLYNPNDPITSNWTNLAPPAGNLCNQAVGNPNLVGDIELLDFEFFTAPKLRISCVDTAASTVYLTGPTAIQPTNHGFMPNHRYVVENVQNSFTQPGQWFLDRSSSQWVLNYIPSPGENPPTDTVIIPQLTQVLVASGLQYVTFRGLTVEHDNFTVPAAGHVSLQQEASITTAISCQNCQHVTFDSDIATQTSGGGLEVIACVDSHSPAWCLTTSTSAVSAFNTIENGAFYDLAAMGLRVGVTNTPEDTDANVPNNTLVQNNVVEAYGRTYPAAFGISQGDGHDNTYTHNDVYDGYHAAVSICSPPCSPGTSNSQGAFNNAISYNHVYNLLQGLMDDGGSLYFATGVTGYAAPGNSMVGNKVHDVTDASIFDADGYGGHGLYLDSLTGEVTVENNLVYRVSGSDLFVTSTPPLPNEQHTIQNNIFAYGRLNMVTNGNPYPTGVCPTSPTLVFNATENLVYFDRSGSSTPTFHEQGGCTYTCGFTYPQLQDWQNNLYWRTDGGFASDPDAFHYQANPGSMTLCGGQPSWTFLSPGAWRGLGEDLQSSIKNPGFANPAYPNDDYSLPGGPPIPGFMVFNPNDAGRTNPVIHPPAIPATFVTATFDPATDY